MKASLPNLGPILSDINLITFFWRTSGRAIGRATRTGQNDAAIQTRTLSSGSQNADSERGLAHHSEPLGESYVERGVILKTTTIEMYSVARTSRDVFD